jgi:para-nitrobenzyl esterase
MTATLWGEPNMIHALTSLLGIVTALAQTDGPPSKGGAAAKPAAAREATAELRIDSGTIRGLVIGDKKDVHVYKGIPYAAPPIGELRWKPPQPVQAWTGVRDCFEFGPACPQQIPLFLASLPEMAIGAPLSEDCLYINVWAPAHSQAAKLPVLYWIHGGGFVMGAGSQPLYDGESLARLGCVVVSINYRLGLFGFLAHPALSKESADKVSGNYGLLDQIEGLRWVQRNVAAFGGDPARVTIFGESAGGMSVLCLMVAPQAKGIFHGAIAQSPAWLNMPALHSALPGQESAEQAGQRLIAASGLGPEAEAGPMRRLEAAALLKAAPALPEPGGPLRLKPLTLQSGPVVDGQLIPDNPNILFASGRQHAVPLIVGNTREEMAIFLMGNRMPADKAAYVKKLQDDLGEFADEVAQAYPVQDAGQIRTAAIQLASDLSFVGETRWIARAHAAAGHKTYRYQFSRGTNRGFLKGLGAHHGAELAYLFQMPAVREDANAVRLGRAMGRYWIQFAATGNPNSDKLRVWPAYRTDGEEMIDFAEDINVLKGHRNDQLDAIEKVLRATLDRTTAKTAK